MMSTATTRLSGIMKVMTVTSRPWGATRIAGSPSTSPTRACSARREKTSACRATVWAPLSRVGAAPGTA
jgi:hypothetical protein